MTAQRIFHEPTGPRVIVAEEGEWDLDGHTKIMHGWLHIYVAYFKSPNFKSKHKKITSDYFL